MFIAHSVLFAPDPPAALIRSGAGIELRVKNDPHRTGLLVGRP